ncbi:MAG: FAD-dependent oxidoreductase [Hydrogenophaga sp.]|nr:FAD-dependent oxidoreductase [Hydrogenophaga sp.]
MAGAACSAALTRRGWHVDLIDRASGPAEGASALPVGMLSPHVTRAPTPLSRLCALGEPDMRRELKRLLPPGQGWMPTEVDNLGHDPGRWPAAVVRPAALVRAWLDESSASGRLATRWSTAVDRLERHDGRWAALDTNGQLVGQAPVAVVATAFGSFSLLQTSLGFDQGALPLRPVQGQLSFAALEGKPLADRPMRNNGVFVPAYEDPGLSPHWPTRVWAMGSTYQRGCEDTTVRPEAHLRNAESLAQMHPEASDELQRSQVEGRLLGWAQIRCASLDRIPLLGAVPDVPAMNEWMRAAGHRRSRSAVSETPRLPGLFLFTALGSRGLTLSHWGGEWLAAHINGEPSPLGEGDQDLERAFDPARFAWRLARRQSAH